jgi:ankyrin repeat protein
MFKTYGRVGRFLLAQLHMDLIVSKATQNEIRKALENLPKGLDESYRDALKRIESQNHDDCQRAKRTLYWISHALRPLTVVELQSALAVMPRGTRLDTGDLVHQDIFLSICAGLVVIDPESNVFRLVHFSAQRYFEGVRADIFPDAQADIASSCLTYISFEAFASGPCPTDQQLEARIGEHPFLEYAAENWGNHLRGKAEDVLEARNLALDFLDDKQKVTSSVQVTFAKKVDREGWSQDFATGVEPLRLAAGFGLTRIARLLVEQGADVRSRDSHGTTALHEAAGIGCDDIVSLLLENGADIAAATTLGATALSTTIVGGHESTALLLLDSGSNLEVRDPYNGTALHTTAYNGYLKGMQLLLSRNADIAARDDCHANTALHVAALFGNEAMVTLLLKEGAPVNDKNKYGCSPLHYAVYGAHEKVVTLLLQSSADVESKDKRESTPLHMAAEGGNAAIVKLLLDKGADHGAMSELGYYASASDEDFDSIIASFLWDEAQGTFLRQVITELPKIRRTNSNMKHGAEVQNWVEGSTFMLPTMSYGGSPLNRAAFRGHVDAARMLLDAGADAGSKDATGTAALWRAAVGGHDAVVSLLLEHGADVNAKDGGGLGVYDPWITDQHETISGQGTALSRAGYYDHPTTVRLLLKWGADTELRDSNAATALHVAAEPFCGEEVVQALLEHKADISAKDGGGATPLLRAAFARRPADIRALLDAGADAKATDNDGLTSLHMVAKSDKTIHCKINGSPRCDHCDAGEETVRLLLEHGVDLEACNGDGLTPLFFATQSGYERISGVLLDSSADVEARDKTGATMLQQAVENAHVAVVRLLCERKADLEAADEDGVTALYWAAEAKNVKIVQVLVESGANVNGTNEQWATPILMAVDDGNESLARVLLAGKMDQKNKDDALFHAVFEGKEKFVEMLLEAGAGRHAGKDAEEPAHETANQEKQKTATDSGYVDDAALASSEDEDEEEEEEEEEVTVVGIAVANNQEGILKLLLTHNVLQEHEGGKLLRDAVLCGHMTTAHLLMEHGVSTEARDEYGCAPLHTAAALGNDDAVRFLIASGADVRAEQLGGGDKGGPTPLFWAANNGHVQTLQILLEAHNPYRAEGGGQGGEEWALHAAAVNGHAEAATLLLDHGADIEAKFEKARRRCTGRRWLGGRAW